MMISYYTYNADTHCESCAAAASLSSPGAKDSEGNPVHPVLDYEAASPSGEWCGTCGDMILPPYLPADSGVAVFEDPKEGWFWVDLGKPLTGRPPGEGGREGSRVWGPFDEEDHATRAAVRALGIES